MKTEKTEIKESKLDTIVRLLKEIEEEQKQEKKNAKEQILDKLSNKECNYFLIKKEFHKGFTVYAMKCDGYEEAYNMCDEVVEEDDDYWILQKDEVEDLIYTINHKAKSQDNN